MPLPFGELLYSDAYGAFDGRPGVVTLEGEVLVLELEDVLHVGIDVHSRQGARLAGELQVYLLEVVQVDMRIACRVDEVARLKSADLRHHHAEQGVRGDVERHAKERVGAPLVELQGELAVCHIELEERIQYLYQWLYL